MQINKKKYVSWYVETVCLFVEYNQKKLDLLPWLEIVLVDDTQNDIFYKKMYIEITPFTFQSSNIFYY